jgi:hypothetical protein
MKTKPIIWFVLGLMLLVVGGLMSLTGGPAKADAVMASQCRERMKDQGSDMLAKCGEKAFATAMTATDANSAAQAISAANNSEVGSNSLASSHPETAGFRRSGSLCLFRPGRF